MITKQERRKERGSALLAELIGAMLVLTLAIMPITVMLLKDQRACREYYYKAVAMEIVDGEMEVLRAGFWKEFKQGAQPYFTNAPSCIFYKGRRTDWPARSTDNGVAGRDAAEGDTE